jgi:hypothetical protein
MANGVDQIEEYRKYRSSYDGGGYNAKVYEVDELAEQFAYGMRRNPLAIRNFLRLAIDSFATKPKHVLLLGHASEYINYRYSLGQASAEILNAVPTWGNPGSDNLFVSASYMNPVPRVPIGRVSAMNGTEIKNYLDKVKMYDSLKRSASPIVGGKEWQKQAIHLVGGDDPFLSLVANNFVTHYTQIISDTPVKATVIQSIRLNNPRFAYDVAAIKQRIDSGVGLLTYFGHSSISSIDFNLSSPKGYTNKDGKFPVFLANGCLAGNIFRHDGNRFNTTNVSISENFVLSPNSGSIAFISNSYLGVINYLDLITRNWYQAAVKTLYGKTLGEIQQEGLRAAFAVTGPADLWNKWMNEQNVLHGDPAIVPFPNQVPDFATDNNQLILAPRRPGIDLDSLRVKLLFYNLGASRNDSIRIEVRRELPSGGYQPIAQVIGRNVNNVDSLWFSVPLKGMFETGTSAIVATLDPWNEQDELNEGNNTARLEFDLASLEIRPVYPYNFAIVKSAPTRFTGSTIYAADDLHRYVFQIDTTERFNSPLLQTIETESLGGAVDFFPTASWTSGRVYYWRVSPLVGGAPLLWRSASFIFMPGNETGYNQSHYYQHRYSLTSQSSLDSITREFGFGNNLQNLYINHGIYSSSGQEDSHFSLSVNGLMSIRSACLGRSIIFNVFDPITFKPWVNDPGGLYGSAMNNCNWYRQKNFEFGYYPASNRKKIMDFLDVIPKGHIVVARLVVDPPYDSLKVEYWKRDTALYGSGNSLYHYLVKQGFKNLDSLNRIRTFGFIFRKDDTLSYKPIYQLSDGVYDRVSLSENLATIDTAGQIESPPLGPASQWKQLLWLGDNYNNDPVGKTMKLELWGINNAGQGSMLRMYNHGQFSNDVSNISAHQYPYLQLRLNSTDPATAKAYQLDYWRLYYQPVADGALSARDHFVFEDTVNALSGTVRFEIAFRNVSDQLLESVLARIILGDEFGNEIVYPLGKLKSLIPGDTAILRLLRPALGLGGRYYLKVETNYDKAVPEQEWFNNSVIIPLYVGTPSLPVTLVDFTATKQSKQALLNWITKSEQGIEQYTVEHSINGRQWKVIGIVAARNNIQENNNYQLIHASPDSGTNYYRLRINEVSGQTTWSAIRKLQFDLPGLSVYPNPFANIVNIAANGTWKAELYDAAGRLILRHTGNGQGRMETRHLKTGNYLIRLTNENGDATIMKLQKQ